MLINSYKIIRKYQLKLIYILGQEMSNNFNILHQIYKMIGFLMQMFNKTHGKHYKEKNN